MTPIRGGEIRRHARSSTRGDEIVVVTVLAGVCLLSILRGHLYTAAGWRPAAIWGAALGLTMAGLAAVYRRYRLTGPRPPPTWEGVVVVLALLALSHLVGGGRDAYFALLTLGAIPAALRWPIRLRRAKTGDENGEHSEGQSRGGQIFEAAVFGAFFLLGVSGRAIVQPRRLESDHGVGSDTRVRDRGAGRSLPALSSQRATAAADVGGRGGRTRRGWAREPRRQCPRPSGLLRGLGAVPGRGSAVSAHRVEEGRAVSGRWRGTIRSQGHRRS